MQTHACVRNTVVTSDINPSPPQEKKNNARKYNEKHAKAYKNQNTSAKVVFFPSTWYLLWLFEYAVRVTTRRVPGICSRTVTDTRGTKNENMQT